MTGINVNDTVTLSISWDGTDLIFSATGPPGSNSYTYTPSDNIGPPIYPEKSIQTRIHLITDTTPTFTWDPVTDANRYRLRIYNHSDENRRDIWRGWVGNPPSGQASITVPPGTLNPNSYYRFRLEAWDAHSPLNVNNLSRTPPSSNDNYRFYTGALEDDHPFIDLANHGVYVSYSASGSNLQFWIKVHDAQGVPGNIKNVKVIHPNNQGEEFLQYYGDNVSILRKSCSCWM